MSNESFQISRHWRMNPLRYRLVGTRYDDGYVSIQPRSRRPSKEQEKPAIESVRQETIKPQTTRINT